MNTRSDEHPAQPLMEPVAPGQLVADADELLTPEARADQRNFALQAAAWQDSLLQSYRGMHVTLQTILLAAGAAVSVFPFTLNPYPSKAPAAGAASVLMMVLGAFHWHSARVLRRVIDSRTRDVSWWHRMVIKLEQRYRPSERLFTKFKIGQHRNEDGTPDTRGQSEIASLFLRDGHHDLTDDDLRALTSQRGPTRDKINALVFGFVTWLWVLFIAATVLPYLYAVLRG
jgi:hypothetical protein